MMDRDEDYFSSNSFPSEGDFSSDSSSYLGDTPELKRKGRIKPIEGLKLQHPRNINHVQYLKQREQGRFTSPSVKRSLHLMLLTPLVQHWLCQGSDLVQLASKLMQRKLCIWEGGVLQHLQCYGLHRSLLDKPRAAKSRLDDISIGDMDTCAIPIPLNFMEFLEILYKIGVDFKCVVPRLKMNLAVILISSYRDDAGDDNILKVLSFLRERNISINNKRADALLTLSKVAKPSPSVRKITRATVKLFELLLMIEAKPRRTNPLEIFLRNMQIYGLDDNVVAIVRLFVENGFYSDDALKQFCSDRMFRMCLCLPERLENIFLIYELLVENSGIAIQEEIRQSSLAKLHEAFSSRRKAPTFMELITFVVDRGLHLNAYLKDDETLLTSLCQLYKGEDLPEVIDFLCFNGLDVNHANNMGENALMGLSKNPLNRSSSIAITQTIKILVQRGIDVRHLDIFCRNAVSSFFHRGPCRCCSYSRLTAWIDCKYWDKLDLLVECGCEVGFSIGGGFLFQVLDKFACNNLCEKCALQYFGMKIDRSGSVATPGLWHFHRFLDFLKRIIQSGAKFAPVYDFCVLESPIIYVCARFKGDELVALVKLLCEHGFDVDARTIARPVISCRRRRRYRRWRNAIEVLRAENRSEVDRIEELINIMKMHGLQESS